MGKMQQRKGAQGEAELRDILNGAGYHVERGGSLTYGTVPDLYGLDRVHIECKRQEKLNLVAAVQQAQRDAQRFNDGWPAVFHRKNRCPWLVTMPLTEWLELYETAQKWEETGKNGKEVDP